MGFQKGGVGKTVEITDCSLWKIKEGPFRGLSSSHKEATGSKTAMAVERQVEADLCMNLTVHHNFQDLIL